MTIILLILIFQALIKQAFNQNCKVDNVFVTTNQVCRTNFEVYGLNGYGCEQYNSSTNQCVVCKSGYYKLNGLCYRSCPTNYIANKYNLVCTQCDTTTCQNLCKTTNNLVSNCPGTQYLQLSNPTCSPFFLGTCAAKTDSLCQKTYYVGKLITYTDNLNTFPGAGTVSDPYYDLVNAIETGLNDCASFTLAKITIYLLNQDHYILNKNYNTITRTSIDFSENISIVVSPLYCSVLNNLSICTNNQVTIYNRVKDFNIFYIYKSLQIENIIFDSTDVLASDSSTNVNRQILCQTGINSSNCSPNLSLFDYSCSGEDSYNSLFEFVINNKMDFTNTLNQANTISAQTLSIKNSVFRNIYNNVYTLIKLSKLSGQVTFDNVQFTNIRICGSVINNYYYDSSGNIIKDTDLSLLSSSDQTYYNNIASKLGCINTYESDPNNNCYKIDVKNSLVSNLQANRQYTTYFNISNLNGISNYIFAGFLNLKNFFGDILLNTNNFTNNNLQTNCALTATGARTLIYLENIKNVVVINNTFSNNMGSISALMNIVINWSFNTYTMFYRIFRKNTFTSNLVNTGATLLNFFGTDKSFCKSINFEYNTLTQNFGCKSSSIVSISCAITTAYISNKLVSNIVLPDMTSVSLNYTTATISNNQYSENYAGIRGGLMSFTGIDSLIMTSNSVKDNGCMLDEILVEYQNKLNLNTIDNNWKYGLSMSSIVNNVNNVSALNTIPIDNFVCLSAGFLFSDVCELDMSFSVFSNNWVFFKKLASSSIITSQSIYIEAKSNITVNWNLRNLTVTNHSGFWRNSLTKSFKNTNFTSFNMPDEFKLGARNSIIHLNLISDAFKGTFNMYLLSVVNNFLSNRGMLVSTKRLTNPNLNLTFNNNTVENNTCYITTNGLIDLKAKNITIIYNNFTRNGAPNIYYWDPDTKDIAANSATILKMNPMLPEFGVIYANLLNNMNLNIINNQFTYNIAKYGSCIVILDSQISSNLLGFVANINNNTFINNQAFQSQIYINYNAKDTANFTMNYCYFEKNNAYTNAGILNQNRLYYLNINNTISNCSQGYFYWEPNSVFYTDLGGSTYQVIISNTVVTGDPAEFNTLTPTRTIVNTLTGGGFPNKTNTAFLPKFKNQGILIFIKNECRYLLNIGYSTCMIGNRLKFYDYGSSFHDNFGSDPTILNTILSNSTMNGSLFYNNWGRYGGAITVGTMSFISIISSTFINNHALFGPAVYIPLFATYKIDNCTFLNNDGVEGDSSITVIFAMDESYTFNSFFKNNYVYGPGSAVGLWMANMIVENCTFDTNPNYNNDTTSIYLVAGIVKVKNSVFFNNLTSPVQKLVPGTLGDYLTDTFYNYYVSTYSAPLGGFIYIGVDSNYLINNCTFTNGLSKLGGAIYVTSAIGQSNITNSLFTNNTASESGGALFLSFADNLYVLSNKFISNSAVQGEGEVAYMTQNYLSYFDNNIIYSTSFSDSPLLYFLTNINIHVSNNYIDGGNYQMLSTRGGAIYSNDLKNFSAVKNKIVNFKTSYGGGIMIESTTRALDTYAYFSGNLIKNNEALHNGGGVYIVDVKNIIFEENTFDGNSARNPFLSQKDAAKEQRFISGGGLYYDCSILVKCQMNMTKNNIFINNFSAGSGAGLAWITYEPLFFSFQYNTDERQQTNYITFNNNSAVFYGNDVAGKMYRAVPISYQLYQKYSPNIENTGQIKPSPQYSFQKYGIGDSFDDSYFAVVDKYFQIIRSDSKSILEGKKILKLTRNNNLPQGVVNITNSSFVDRFRGTSAFYTSNGLVVINNLQLLGFPGFNYNLTFCLYTSNIDNCIEEFNITVSSRLCDVGESLQANGECNICPNSTYKLHVPFLSNESSWACSPCDKETNICLGSVNLRPNKGYWRNRNDTSNMITCYGGDEACLAGNAISDPLGNCAEGYKGVLCSVCDKGFSKMGDFSCLPCPTNYLLNGILILLFITFYIAAVVFTIRTILKAKSTHLNICLRILLNHIQILGVLGVYSLNWPKVLQEFIRGMKKSIDLDSQLLSIDCFIKQSSSMSSFVEHVIYMRVIGMIIGPAIILLLDIGIWYLIKRHQKSFKDFKEDVIGTFVVIFFTIFPNIFYYCFFIFTCLDIEDKSYFVYDLTIECWTYSDNHLFVMYFLCIPGIVGYVFVLPYYLLKFMFKERERLKLEKNRKLIGFIVDGYRKDKFYWEYIIFSRKLLLIISKIYMENSSASVKSLFVMLIFLFYLIVQLTAHPYESNNLNRLEEYSLTIAGLSLYLTSYIIAINNDPTIITESGRPIILALLGSIIIAINAFFVFSWIYYSWTELSIVIIESTPDSIRNFITDKCTCCCKNDRKISYVNRQRLKILEQIILVENNTNMIQLEKDFNFYLQEKKNSLDYDLSMNPNKKMCSIKKDELIVTFLKKFLRKSGEAVPNNIRSFRDVGSYLNVEVKSMMSKDT